MSKVEKIGKSYFIKETGEDIAKSVYNAIVEEERINKFKRLYRLKNESPESLDLEEIELLIKMDEDLKKENKTDVNKIKLDFREKGYFTCRRDLNLVLELDDYTKAFLYSISHMITHDGRLKYNNNRLVNNLGSLKIYLKISNDRWSKHIKPDIDKFNIISKEKIDNKWVLLLNPIFATTTREVTETMFIAFHKQLKEYLHPLQYLYL